MSTLAQLKYGYDQASNRLYRRDEVARSAGAGFDELYGYDDLQRLTSMQRGTLNGTNTGLSSGPALTQGWNLDQTGNWSGFNQTVEDALTQTRTHNTVNEITGISETVGLPWDTPAYDANGNMTSLPQPESLDESFTATWDAWNRLVKLEDTSGTVAEYEYDGLNRRIAKTTGSTTRRAYYSDQWQVLEERVGTSTSADSQYLWGTRYVDDLVLRDRGSERLYSLSDALSNVVALTDATGAVKERFAYQPYGQSEELNPNFTSYSGSDYLWTYRFTGRELDLESGLQLNRMRYLHQKLGRWVSRDPIGYEAESVNLYLYVRNNLIGFQDPSGLIIPGPLFPTPIPVPCPPAAVAAAQKECAPYGGLNPTKPLRCFVWIWLGRVIWQEVRPVCNNTGDCDLQQYLRLQRAKNAYCNLPRSCQGIQCCVPAGPSVPRPDCDEIDRRLANNNNCIGARRNVMNQCFKGGDARHRRELQRVINDRDACLKKQQECKC